MELIFVPDRFDAQAALYLGLVLGVPTEQLTAETMRIARALQPARHALTQRPNDW